MGRKNGNVQRKNRRLNRRERGAARSPRPEIERIRLGDLVVPDGQCLFQTPRRPKASFATQEKAEKALAQAQAQRARIGSAHVEKRIYPCPEGGCGGWHLTSRETFDERIWRERRALSEKVAGA